MSNCGARRRGGESDNANYGPQLECIIWVLNGRVGVLVLSIRTPATFDFQNVMKNYDFIHSVSRAEHYFTTIFYALHKGVDRWW